MKKFILTLKPREYTNTAKDWYESAQMFKKQIDLDIKDITDNMAYLGEETPRESINRIASGL